MDNNSIILQNKIRIGRLNLLLAIVLTSLNVILVALSILFTFYFSAIIPQLLIEKMPNAIGIALAIIFIGILLGCWYYSKKSIIGMVIAAILFFVDTLILLMLLFLSLSILNYLDYTIVINILFHAWILYYFVGAIIANKKLKKIIVVDAAAVTENNIPQEPEQIEPAE